MFDKVEIETSTRSSDGLCSAARDSITWRGAQRMSITAQILITLTNPIVGQFQDPLHGASLSGPVPHAFVKHRCTSHALSSTMWGLPSGLAPCLRNPNTELPNDKTDAKPCLLRRMPTSEPRSFSVTALICANIEMTSRRCTEWSAQQIWLDGSRTSEP